MDSAIARLMALFDAGASSDTLCLAACELLLQPVHNTSDDDSLRAATMAWRALEVGCRNAFRRFPAPAATPDIRALVLFETLSVARNAGLYEPSELAGASSSPGWVAGECLRLHALAIVLRAAGRELERGEIDAMAYRQSAASAIHRLATARVVSESKHD